jgi:HAE1 family hydrophobic/amphiphilic exporter-1
VSDLEQLPLVINSPLGQTTLPLGQIATIRQGLGPAQITHLDAELVVTVEANTAGRSLSEVMKDINARIDKMNFPAGVRLTQGGEVDSQAEVFGRIFAALGVAVMLMYLILVVQFGSFLEPLAILVSLPLSLIGVMLALLFWRSTLNVFSMIGLVMLMGLVTKNAILLVDFANHARKAGATVAEAVLQAGLIRMRPIMMTTAAMVFGMLPLALALNEGGEIQAPMGRAIIGGVITSTLLTLVVVPVIYSYLVRERRSPAGAGAGSAAVPMPASKD